MRVFLEQRLKFLAKPSLVSSTVFFFRWEANFLNLFLEGKSLDNPRVLQIFLHDDQEISLNTCAI